VILTKCHGLVADEVGTRTYMRPELGKEARYQNQYGQSRAAIFNQVQASLDRLETPYIDLYGAPSYKRKTNSHIHSSLQIHRYDPEVPAEETMKALHDLVQSGKVRYIGASSMRAWQFCHLNHVAEKNGWTKFVSMQSEHSLLYREEV